MQKEYVIRFIRAFREDVFDAYLFSSISQFDIIANKWNEGYNNNHPLSFLDSKNQGEFGKQINLFGLNPKSIDSLFLSYRLS